VLGYRLAMILSGGVALIWTDATQGSGWTWPRGLPLMAMLMAGAAVLSALVLPPLPALPPARPRRAPARNDLRGFAAVVAAVVVGVPGSADRFTPLARRWLGPWLAGGTLPPALQQRWVDLAGAADGHRLHAAAGGLGGAAGAFSTPCWAG
jgi:PAT family beta-lactamase induction signal transducer AmpG